MTLNDLQNLLAPQKPLCLHFFFELKVVSSFSIPSLSPERQKESHAVRFGFVQLRIVFHFSYISISTVYPQLHLCFLLISFLTQIFAKSPYIFYLLFIYLFIYRERERKHEQGRGAERERIFFFNFYLFLREKETECEWGRGRERGRHRI